MNYIDGWHFAADTLRDGTPRPDRGVILPRLSGTVPCKKGLYHLSVRALDALKHAPGPHVARVRLRRCITTNRGDKHAGQERENLSDYVDVTQKLRDSARFSARRVVHFWDPEQVVIDWLNAGDESLRESAWESVRVASVRAAPESPASARAAQAAALESARCTTWESADVSVWESVAWESIRCTTWASAGASAWESARVSAAYSAGASASGSTSASPWESVRDSARAEINGDLEARLYQALGVDPWSATRSQPNNASLPQEIEP